jgi:lipid-A-disaccharide synthase
MPNIIAERRVVPELLHREATPAAVAEAALSLLRDPDRLAQTRRELLEVRGALGPPEVSGRVAEIALEMVGLRPPTSDNRRPTNGTRPTAG